VLLLLLLLSLLLLLLSSSSSSLVTGCLSFLVLLFLSQWWTPPLRLQVSACSTFLMMCDVPSMVVFVKNLLSVVLVLFPGRFFLNSYLEFPCNQQLLVWQRILCSKFSEFLYFQRLLLLLLDIFQKKLNNIYFKDTFSERLTVQIH
jgi:hypothetical protein